MKLVNIASLDPEITNTGRSGLKNASINDRGDVERNAETIGNSFAVESDQAMRGTSTQLQNQLGGEVHSKTRTSMVQSGEDRAVHEPPYVLGKDFFPCRQF